MLHFFSLNILVCPLGLPHRLAHRIVANMVAKVLEEGFSANGITPEFVDEVAREAVDRPSGLTLEQVKKALVSRHVSYVG